MGQNKATFSSDQGPKTEAKGAADLCKKKGPKGEYKGKYNMEVPNGVEPFFNVEEGLKISIISVYNMLKNRFLMGQK